jgi:hypothetical protein
LGLGESPANRPLSLQLGLIRADYGNSAGSVPARIQEWKDLLLEKGLDAGQLASRHRMDSQARGYARLDL